MIIAHSRLVIIAILTNIREELKFQTWTNFGRLSITFWNTSSLSENFNSGKPQGLIVWKKLEFLNCLLLC